MQSLEVSDTWNQQLNNKHASKCLNDLKQIPKNWIYYFQHAPSKVARQFIISKLVCIMFYLWSCFFFDMFVCRIVIQQLIEPICISFLIFCIRIRQIATMVTHVKLIYYRRSSHIDSEFGIHDYTCAYLQFPPGFYLIKNKSFFGQLIHCCHQVLPYI